MKTTNPRSFSASVKEELIQIQLRRLEIFRRRGAREEAESLSAVIARELEQYHGPRLKEFRGQLDKKE